MFFKKNFKLFLIITKKLQNKNSLISDVRLFKLKKDQFEAILRQFNKKKKISECKRVKSVFDNTRTSD